jgi:hypothetical protein
MGTRFCRYSLRNKTEKSIATNEQKVLSSNNHWYVLHSVTLVAYSVNLQVSLQLRGTDEARFFDRESVAVYSNSSLAC